MSSTINNKLIYLLLKIVHEKGNAFMLLNEGLNFKKISELSNYSINNKLITIEEGNFSLTNEGEIALEKLNQEFRYTDKHEWIQIEKESKISRLDIDFIFLPDPNEISF